MLNVAKNNGRAKPSPLALKQIEGMLLRVRDRALEAIKILDRAANVLLNQKKPDSSSLITIVELYAKAGRIDAARQLMAKLPNPIPPNDASWRQQLQQYVDCHQRTILGNEP